MLYSQGISLDDLEIGRPELKNPRKVWSLFASHYYLFRGTPTRIWMDYVFQELFGLQQRFSASTADLFFDTIAEKLKTPEFLPRALFERFNIEVLRPSTRWTIFRRSAHRAGKEESCPPSAPTRSSIRSLQDLPSRSTSWASRPAKTPLPGPAT
jgi:glucuronate isomerase